MRLTQRLIELGKTGWELASSPVENHRFTRPDGTIWVQDFNPETFPLPDSWTAIDSTGRIIGRLIFPARQVGRRPVVQGSGRDYVIFKRNDSDGAQSLFIYPILTIDGRNR